MNLADTSAVYCRDLRKTYPAKPPVEALQGVDLDVSRGECFGVLGPNGAGKTTTVEILEGLMPPTSGEVRILGKGWSDQGDSIRQQIGISLQETRLSERLSVLETLTLFRSFYSRGLTPQEAIERVSLQEKSTSWVQNLSGGQRQRLAVAVALIGDPQLLFLDEPTTGLDPQSRRQLWNVIGDLRKRERTVLLTTHYMEEAERLCDRVAIVDRGRVIATGTPRALIAGLGAAHVIEFTLEGGDSQPAEAWRQVAGVTDSEFRDGCYRLTVAEPHRAVPDLMRQVRDRNVELASLTTRHASLDDVFVKLTGRNLEDERESPE